MKGELIFRVDRSDYLDACARIRGIKTSSLVRRLFNIIAQDQLVASILDDADDMRRRNKSEHRYRPEA